MKIKSPLSRVQDWRRKRKQKGKEKEEEKKSPPEPEKPVEPVAEETEELTQEPSTQEAEETKELAPEPLTEKTEEPTTEPAAAEEEKELAPEPPTQEAEETTAEPVMEEPAEEELAPEQPLAEKTEKPTPKPRRLGFLGFFKKRKQKKKEKERTLESQYLRILTFGVTLASMLLGLSILPLFPQPLPTILSFLLAFVTFKRPLFGMPIGGLLIGLGLMYNLSKLNFIVMLGEPEVRGIVVFVFLFLFTALPIIFRSHKAAIAINIGIIAAISLFFSQTYFLAIPLIVSSVVFFKKISGLTVVYYVLISVPLQIMQYLQHVSQITRVDWWVEPGSSPPIFVPLTGIFKDVQESMLQFRLYDTSKVVYSITDQVTSTPPTTDHTVTEMISHYIDSFPGIILFLVMVIGLVLIIALLRRTLFASSNIAHAERLFPILTAAVATALFFLLASGLQDPLAFRADINGSQMVIGTLAAVLFTFPAFLMDTTPKRRTTIEMIIEKAKDLEAKLQVFEENLNKVKSSLPVSCGTIEAKMLIIKDKLNDILNKTSANFYETSEIEGTFNELDSMNKEIDNLSSELNVSLGEYQIFINCEYSKWVGQLKDIGLEAEIKAKTDFQKELPLEERIDRIKGVLEGGTLLANEVIHVSEQVYDIIRSFYDPNLPEENQSITFATKKLDEKATPWIAIDALFSSLNNWKKQYSVQISKSVENLKNSLGSLANITAQNVRLLPVLGDDFSKIIDSAKKAENIKIDVEKTSLNAVDVILIRDAFQSLVTIARDVLSILYEKLKSKEKAIESLLPTENYPWEKNVDLRAQMNSAMEIILNSSRFELSQVLENLPKSLSYVDECIETIALYNEQEELLLNYPIAEIALEDLFRQKKRISAEDLPFEPKYAEAFLRLFYSQRYPELSFDEAKMFLTKKT